VRSAASIYIRNSAIDKGRNTKEGLEGRPSRKELLSKDDAVDEQPGPTVSTILSAGIP
jgi:hypothetical protein